MRLDKYLKVSRIIKRRSVANDACDAGRVSLNGKTAKPAADVKAGDIIEIRFGGNLIKAEIVSVNENAKKNEASEMFRIIEEK
jgi:ribosomal 50S subunit-recycling heat shock protein